MADVPQRLDLGLGKADPEEYFRRLALYSYAVAPLFPGRKQEGQYVPGLRQYAAGGRILEDEFPSAYMPGVGRQVMQEGGAPQPGDEASQFVRGQLSLPTAAEQARIDEILRPSPLMEQYGGYGTTQAIRQNVARPMPTSSEFVQHQLRGNEPQLPQMDREAYNTMKELAVAPLSLAAYNIPVAGQILGAVDLARGLRDVGQAVQSGDKGDIAAGIGEAAMASTGVKGKLAKTAAAAMAGMMPEDAQAMFFGESAKLTPQLRSALEAAKRALVGGAKPAETWQKYGFAPDPAGKMVGELSDAAARLNPAGLQKFRSGEQMTLGEILSHPDYYDLYPSMYTAKLNPVTPNDERVRGYYNQLTDTLYASTRLDDRALLANLLHEPTHRMQLIEGMSPGSDPRHFTNPFVKSTEDREDLASLYGSEVIRDFMNKNPNIDRYEAAKFLREQKVPIGPQPTKFLGLTPEAADETKKLLQSRIEDTFRRYPDPNYQYKMSLGEVAARAPGERLEMSEAARRAAFPFADENIIVRPPHPTRIQNVASPEWERDRAQALELSRQLQREPLPPEIPSKFSIETTDAEEELMRIAQALEAQKRAGKAFVAGAAPAKDKGGSVIKAALKTIGKLMPEGSGYVGVPGKPSLVNLPGIGKVEARPIPEIESAASKYMQSTGRPGEHEIASFPEFNPAFATKVAEAFAEMKHRPGDPAVRRAYDALIDETMAQYRAAKDTGIDFRFLKEGQQDPYAASPALGYEDIVNRGRLFVFPTEQGFGSSGGLIADNPLLKRAGQVGDKPDAVVNDAFRIVHDLYGHFGPGNPFFRAPGEERAYQLHSRMFGPEALPAATLETRGQNSWLNYGPYGEANRSALGADTHFAEQKIGRMPEWTQAPAPAVGSDVEEYIRSLTGKADGGEVARGGFEKGGVIKSALSAATAALKKYKDPKSELIQNWEWRPLSDVQKDIGVTAVPEHVQNFGRYMENISDKAKTEGLDPEDVIKAYMITRSSIQREGRTPQKLMSYGIPVRQTSDPLIRPEGHMADFLTSPAGIKFLNEARRGELSQDVVDAAVGAMRPFGMSATEPKAMDWARKNLVDQSSSISDMVARAREGASPVEEWRQFTRNVSGIGPAKSGFFASLLGRGDIPTLDARQAILHTGMKNAEAQKIMQQKSGRAGEEAVDRLSARQQALGFELPQSLSPFYQHLAHHTVWDAIGKEKTTHQDIIDAMSPRAYGGEVERDGFDKGGLIKAAIATAKAIKETGKRISPEEARSMIASPFSEDPVSVQNALKYAQSLRVPQGEERLPGGFYNIKQTRPVSAVTSTIKDIPGVKPLSPVDMSWEDFVKLAKGGTLFNVAGDRSNLGRLTAINGRPLAWNVDLHAGPKYMLEPNENIVWANNPAHATGFRNAILEATKKGPVFGVYHPMGVQSVDSSHNMIDAVLAQIGRGDVGKDEMSAVDDLLRKGAQAEKNKIGLAAEAMKNWPGFANAQEASEFARGLEGTRRSEIVRFLDRAPLLQQGFPAIGETRVAITDPALKAVSGNMLGHRIVQFDPEVTQGGSLAFTHSTYNAPTSGRYIGDVPLVQSQYVMPNVEQDIMTKLAKGDRVVHPYSTDPLGRGSWRKSLETRKLGQEINDQMLDSIMTGMQRQKDYGLRRGGSVIDDAIRVSSDVANARELEAV